MRSPIRIVLICTALIAQGAVAAQRGQRSGAAAALQDLAAQELQVLEDRLALYSTYPNELQGHPAELKKLADAAESPGDPVRQIAMRVMGRLQLPAHVPTLIAHLGDASPAVRAEAASALSQSLHKPKSDQVAGARAALLSGIKTDPDPTAVGAMLEALGNLPADDGGSEIEDVLAAAVESGRAADTARALGAARGIEAFTRRNSTRTLSDASRTRLRRAVAPGLDHRPDAPRLAVWFSVLEALQNAHDDDIATILKAADYHCPAPKDTACGWQVRRVATLMLDPTKPVFDAALDRALHDAAYQVRFEALRPWVRGHLETKTCQALLDAMTDDAPQVAMKAMDPQIMRTSCLEHDFIIQRLTEIATTLGAARSTNAWQVPSRALSTLAVFAPKDAARLLPIALTHSVWEVRAAAAGVAVTVGDEGAALALARDVEPNVQTEAIKALVKLKSEKLTDVVLGILVRATGALAKRDCQLLLAAADALKSVPALRADEAVSDLLDVLDRVTADDRDTSRDARLAIIERVGALQATTSLVGARLSRYTTDADPLVATAAAVVLQKVTGAETKARPRVPFPTAPSPIELWQLQRCCTTATITMTNGDMIRLNLAVHDAPVTVWRFVNLARKGYYDNLTFHRVVTNFVIQGGSPGANEYMGDQRFVRDEIGSPNVRGAVGMSTRGLHTGDMQLFVDLVDVPRLDHEYTIFATVTNLKDEDVIDRILEGATIRTVTVR